MKINITAKGFELTPAIRDYIEEKMGYIEKFAENWSAEGSAELDFEAAKTTKHHNKGDVFYAEANLKIPGTLIRVQKTNKDLHAAIDEVKEVMAKKIKEYKERIRK